VFPLTCRVQLHTGVNASTEHRASECCCSMYRGPACWGLFGGHLQQHLLRAALRTVESVGRRPRSPHSYRPSRRVRARATTGWEASWILYPGDGPGNVAGEVLNGNCCYTKNCPDASGHPGSSLRNDVKDQNCGVIDAAVIRYVYPDSTACGARFRGRLAQTWQRLFRHRGGCEGWTLQ
jgi:hypothetical protein